ncbi:MAG: hypothetical protein OXE99_13345, partial [Cellvibrionales bacterium]|nr:hypothetical protein [Cellvibrionales bacterium]
EASKKILEKYSNTPEDSKTFQMGMLYYDQSSINEVDESIDACEEKLLNFYQSLDEAGIASFYSSFSSVTFLNKQRTQLNYLSGQSVEMVLPKDKALLQTQLLSLWMDFFEMNYSNRRVKPKGTVKLHNTLGEQLLYFLKQQADRWVTSYFTGSIVSNLIGYIDENAEDFNGKSLRGPNEHSLACGALANWQLYDIPSLIVVTSAMVDEFKGTLANLREANAKGIIIVAENRTNQWYSFQGTITPTEDTRDVLKARRIPFEYLDDLDNLNIHLTSAFKKYHENNGPVVLLVTQKVLEASVENVDIVCHQEQFLPKPVSQMPIDEGAFSETMQIINEGPDKILWQLGALDDEERFLTAEIADKAGIALVDSLIHPGSSSKYINGRLNPNYIGTLSIYGFSPKVYNFLYTNDKINSINDQSLFFIKSRIAQVCTPFSEGRFERKIHLAQVTHNPNHLAPFTDIPLLMDSKVFLRRVLDELNITEEKRNKRLQLISELYDSPSDVVSKMPSTPMSPNYFFHQFGQLLDRLIVNDGYRYTGIYDVGRCGISAIRNLPCTDRGFSGWYGRALMGDAMLASNFVTHTSPHNILAFIGDGARGIVPDILPSFVDNLLTLAAPLNKNITIMTFCNGGLSVINTYQERILFNRTSKQMRLVNIAEKEFEETISGFKVCVKNITSFNNDFFQQAITEKNRLNLFSISVGHNNEGDGITLATAKGWQRDPAKTADAVALKQPMIEVNEPLETID